MPDLLDLFPTPPNLVRRAGWGKVRGSAKRHYFARDARKSLCGRWSDQEIFDDAVDRDHSNKRNCDGCQNRIAVQVQQEVRERESEHRAQKKNS